MEVSLGELLSLLCAIVWAIAVVMFKHSGESMSANALNLVKNIIGLALLVPTALIVEGTTLPNMSAHEWVVLILTGYIGLAIADTLFFQALRYLGASRTAIITSLYSPFVVILSLIFLGEQLATWQWLGFTAVLLGILLVVYQKQQESLDQTTLFKGSIIAVTSIFLTACSIVAMKPVLENEGFFWLVSLRLLAGIVGMLVGLIVCKQMASTFRSITTERHDWGKLFIASLFGTYLSLLFWLAGFKYTEASIASVLNETTNIFIVLLAWMFLKEDLDKRKLIGVLITFAGVVVFLA